MADPKTPWCVEVHELDFERDVIERSKEVPVVVDFWAPWCGPCLTLGPLLERLAGEYGGRFLLAKVDVDRAPNLAAALAISSIPLVMAFRDARLVSHFLGLLPEEEVRKFLDSVLPCQDERRTAGEPSRLEEQDPEAAERLYRETLERDEANEEACLGLARLLVARGTPEAAAEARGILETLLEAGEHASEVHRLKGLLFLREKAAELPDAETLRRRLAADPSGHELRYELGCALAGEEKYAEALGELLEAARADKLFAREKVREAMVSIFYVIGARSELADEYRTQLSRVLY